MFTQEMIDANGSDRKEGWYRHMQLVLRRCCDNSLFSIKIWFQVDETEHALLAFLPTLDFTFNMVDEDGNSLFSLNEVSINPINEFRRLTGEDFDMSCIDWGSSIVANRPCQEETEKETGHEPLHSSTYNYLSLDKMVVLAKDVLSSMFGPSMNLAMIPIIDEHIDVGYGEPMRATIVFGDLWSMLSTVREPSRCAVIYHGEACDRPFLPTKRVWWRFSANFVRFILDFPYQKEVIRSVDPTYQSWAKEKGAEARRQLVLEKVFRTRLFPEAAVEDSLPFICWKSFDSLRVAMMEQSRPFVLLIRENNSELVFHEELLHSVQHCSGDDMYEYSIEKIDHLS